MESDGWWWKANQVAAALLRWSDGEMEPPSIFLIGAINWWNRLKDGETEELSPALWFSCICPIFTPLSAYRSLYLQLSLFKASLLLLIISPSLFSPAWGEGEERKMYTRSTLLNRHSQIIDYPITETGRVALCLWMTGVTARPKEAESGRKGKRGRNSEGGRCCKERRWDIEKGDNSREKGVKRGEKINRNDVENNKERVRTSIRDEW